MGRIAVVGPVTGHIAATLRAKKEALGWSLDQIASRTPWDRNTVDRALKGQTAIAVEAFVDIAQAMGLNPAHILRDAARVAAELSSVSATATLERGQPLPEPTKPRAPGRRPSQSE